MDVIGVKDVNFKAKDGNVIKGVKLFVTDDSVRVDSGVACDCLFLSDGLLNRNGLSSSDLLVGQHLLLSYNKFGKIQSVTIG